MNRPTIAALLALSLAPVVPAQEYAAGPFTTDAEVRPGETWEGRFHLENRGGGGEGLAFTVAWETRVAEAGQAPVLAVRLTEVEVARREEFSTETKSFDAEQIARLLDRDPTPADGADLRLVLDASWRVTGAEGFEHLFWLFLRLGTLDDAWMEGLPTWFRLVAKRMGPEAYAWAHARFATVLAKPMNDAAIRFWNGAVGAAAEALDRTRGGTTFQPGDEYQTALAKVRYLGTTRDGAWGHFRAEPVAGGQNPFQPAGAQGYLFALDRAGRVADLRYEFVVELPIGPAGQARQSAAFELLGVKEPKE